MRSDRLSAVLLGLMLCTAGWAENGPSSLQPMDVFELEWADHPVVAPDGRSVVYQRMSFDRLKDRRNSALWLRGIGSDLHQPLTGAGVNAGSATWSPDGKRLAWVQRDGQSAQVHVRWMDSGRSAAISSLASGPSGLRWSPDGTWLAFSMFVPKPAVSWAKLPTAPKGAEWAAPPKVIEEMRYRADGQGYLDSGASQIFVLPAEGGSARQLTFGEIDYRGALAWTADGRSLLLSANQNVDTDPLDSEIYRLDVASGKLTALTDRDGPDQAPSLSPDGRWMAWLGFDDRKLAAHSTALWIMEASGGTPRQLADDLDRSISGMAWDQGSRGLYLVYGDQGQDVLGYVERKGGPVKVLDRQFGGTAMGRPYGGGDLDANGGVVVYTRGDASRPADLAYLDKRGNPRSLTDLNADILPYRILGEVEERWVESSADGLRIQSWLVKPPHFDPARKYPLLLEIHGGPHADYGPRFAPETQLYAAHGYVVLYVNPRGSTSYGEQFTNLIQNAYPGHDYDDLMSSVDAVIAEGYVDTKRLFVTGGSGGGVLTSWIVGHTDRFRAAVVAKPVINWISFSLTADAYPFFTRYWFPAMPWEDPKHYLDRSPLMYVGKVTTPTMLITGESDHRTPISEAEQFYQALQLRQIKSALVRVPGASHGINLRPSHMLAQVLYTIGWFEHVEADASAAAAIETDG